MAGRPKSFDEDAAMNAFLNVFWTKGYGGTSIDDLQAAAGIKRGSFYATFGSKDDVFQTVLERYWDNVTAPGLSNMDPGAPHVDGIAAFLRHVGEFMSQNPFRGCLLLSSASAKPDPQQTSEAIADRMARLEGRLQNHLKSAPDLADADPDRIEAITAYVLTVLLGLNAMARTGHDGKAIRLAANCAAQSLSLLSSRPPIKG